ncbi:MAG: Membrane-anchored glycerophosphoryl diester phosphodiesterase (GDPDase), rane domain [Rhodoglobus sp.]|nr:Membrane-anchored glycerophosphoryl diester phosphodiesterase (GDPDase), rane domain [Rhodoglobus sp.]
MTDNTSWKPPAAQDAPAPAPASPFAPAPGTVPSQAAPGWTPPPRPGLIPLRPLTLGALLGAAFQVLRRNPRPTFGFALVVTGIASVVGLLLYGLLTVASVARLSTATSADYPTLAAGSIATSIVGYLVVIVVALVASALLQGIISLEVARGTLGEKLRLGGLMRLARGRIGALIGWSLLLAGGIVVLVTVFVLVVVLLVTAAGPAGIALAVLLYLLALAGGAVLFAWLGTRLSLVPSALMLERLPLRAAVRRSWSLTTGYFWKTFGIQLLVIVIVQVVSSVIATPIAIIFVFASTLLNPNGDNSGMITTLVIVGIVTVVASIVLGAVAAVLQAATPALIYIDIRMRKEGLDLELSRFVEARQAGDTSVPDPFLPRAPAETQQAATASPWS